MLLTKNIKYLVSKRKTNSKNLKSKTLIFIKKNPQKNLKKIPVLNFIFKKI